MRAWIVVGCLLVGCRDDGGMRPQDAAGGGGGGVAAGGAGGAAGAGTEGAVTDAPIDARPFDCATSPTAGAHKVFLNFDGVTLTKGTGANDSVTNVVTFCIGVPTPATSTPWRMGAGDRATQIADAVCAIRQSFFPFDVEMVTTRPA